MARRGARGGHLDLRCFFCDGGIDAPARALFVGLAEVCNGEAAAEATLAAGVTSTLMGPRRTPNERTPGAASSPPFGDLGSSAWGRLGHADFWAAASATASGEGWKRGVAIGSGRQHGVARSWVR
mmetsp:Transcript_125232/g.359664  ORF Transcript_125232/g.359664 Transcript_125232/m.359664 type:complete len:125 (+) Transcript_125232:278-652(+)